MCTFKDFKHDFPSPAVNREGLKLVGIKHAGLKLLKFTSKILWLLPI